MNSDKFYKFLKTNAKIGEEDFMSLTLSGEEMDDNKKLIEKYNMPTNLKIIYNSVGNKSTRLFEYSFLSSKDLLNYENYYDNILDIGYKNLGMGHYETLSMFKDKTNEKRFFFKHDGGSNGIERSIRHDEYNNPNYKPEKLYSFDEIISIISLETSV